ncbi:40S ribosomal protein S7-like protein [Tanacetum coccineum]
MARPLFNQIVTDWFDCPYAFKAQYVRRDHGPNPFILLEDVASQDLWIWHDFFGVARSNNDINVLYQSPLFNDLKTGRAPEIPFVANCVTYRSGYYLVDGIYPELAPLLKTIPKPSDDDHKRILYKQKQESTRKDVERAFGVLKKKWAILANPTRALKKERIVNMMKKIQKDKDVEPSEFEESVAQALFDLENANQDLKSDLKDLYINGAAQIDVSGNRKAVVIHVPYRLRKAFRKIHLKLVRELEKKFSGKDVVLIATRRMLPPPKKGSAATRPRNRTLTAVHDSMLEDIVHPAEIVGKRVRYRVDGSKTIKIYLDPKARNDTEYKLETFSGVYRKLCGKDVVFEYPITEA